MGTKLDLMKEAQARGDVTSCVGYNEAHAMARQIGAKAYVCLLQIIPSISLVAPSHPFQFILLLINRYMECSALTQQGLQDCFNMALKVVLTPNYDEIMYFKNLQTLKGSCCEIM